MSRPARVIIDVGAARANLELVKRLCHPARVLAVVKAAAYGHGFAPMARAFAAADALGVAFLEEAAELRAAGARQPIVLLEGVFSDTELEVAASLDIQLVVHQEEQVRQLERWRGPPFMVWLKVDTGMHRLGFLPEAASAVRTRLEASGALAGPLTLMTHLANAQALDNAAVQAQVQLFDELTQGWRGPRSIANSAALLGYPATRRDWVRPGIMLYGVDPFERGTNLGAGLRPVMTLESALMVVRELPAGAGVGYGSAFICPERMPVGVVAIGYGDGYPYTVVAGAPVAVAGQATTVIGRVSMDMLMVDLRPVPNARVGDRVELWGNSVPVRDVARHVGGLSYSLLCNAGLRAVHLEIDSMASVPHPVPAVDDRGDASCQPERVLE